MARTEEDIRSDIDYVKRQINELEADSQGIRLRLDDYKRQADEWHTRIYNEWRMKKQQLNMDAVELENKINHYENEKNRLASEIRSKESEAAAYEQDSYRDQQERNRLQHDDIDDSQQWRDIDRFNSCSNYDLHKADEYRREIDNLRSEYDRNEREWYDKQKSLDSLGGQRVDMRREYIDQRQQIKLHFDDLARTDKGNLRDNLNRRRQLESELKGFYSELDNFQHLSPGESYSQDYTGFEGDDEKYLNREWSEEVDDNDDEYTPGMSTMRTPSSSGPSLGRENEIKLVAPSDPFLSRRKVLQKYALKTGNDYIEYRSIEGFRAKVGTIHYFYRDESNLTVYKPGGVPSIEDFKVILDEEKRLGRRTLPLGNIVDPLYKASLIIAADKSGIRPLGKVRLSSEEIGRLPTEVRVSYKRFLQRIDELQKGLNPSPKNSTGNSSPFPPPQRGGR